MKKLCSFCGRLWILLTIVGLTALGIYGFTAKANEDVRQILYINSYSYGWDGVQQQIDGIRETVGDNCELQYEFMESQSVNELTARQMFYDRMEYRMSQEKTYEAVIVSGNAALEFSLEYQDVFFKDIPLVFIGVDDEKLIEEAFQRPLVYGVEYAPSIRKNIELAQQLNPNLKKVAAIVDESEYGRKQSQLFIACQEDYPDLEFSEINASELTAIGVKRKIWHLEEKDTALIYLAMTENQDGDQYTLTQGINVVTEIAKLPVFCTTEAWIGNGAAGGNVVCMYLSGADAAKLALAGMNGEVPQERLMSSPTEVYLDESVLREFDVNLSRIPEGAHIVNHQPTFWERNRSTIRGAIFPCILLMMLVLVFLYENRRKKVMMIQMEEMNQKLMESSQHDFLTQLPNRNKFTQDITNCVNAKIPCTVFMLDIDDFKSINDTMGHSAGDEVLQEISRRLKELESGSFTAYRFAGDEFTIIFRHTERSAVEVAAAKCAGVFELPMEVRGEKRKVTGSIGGARYPKDAKDAEQLVVCADKAMYHVKKGGKNAFNIYEENA